MRFINRTGNTYRLNDVGLFIPFLGNIDQEIATDTVLRSNKFQSLILQGVFEITSANESRIEQNLLKMAKGLFPPQIISPKLIMRGHFAGPTGYAKANRNMLYALARAGVDVSISPLSDLNGIVGRERTILNHFNTIPDPDAIMLHSSIPSFAEKSDARYSILYTTVEASTIPQQFVTSCNLYDEVWTVSDFCKEVLSKSGVTRPINVIPNIINTKLYSLSTKPRTFKPDLKPFKFLSVMTWGHRKGYDALLKAYLKAFSGSDPVSLIIVSRYNLNNDGLRTLKVDTEIKWHIKQYGGSNPAHIARCGYPMEEVDMPRLYKACDAFVLPSRGEGFGMPYMEASLCGLPVIATNYSGQKMFLNNENSYLVDIDKVSRLMCNETNVHYWDGQDFPELLSDKFIGDLGDTMREVYENQEKAKTRNEILRASIVKDYNSSTVASLAKKRLDEIWKSLS